MKTLRCVVALGDSFTAGVGDPVEGFAQLGAIDQLADVLKQANPALQFTNLGAPDLLVSEIREQQLETALALQPDLVMLVAGANDILKGRFNAAGLEQEFQTLFEAFSRRGAVVIVVGIPHFPLINTMKESHQTGLTRIITKANQIIQRLAEQYQFIFIDSWSISLASPPEDWSADSVHLNARGYFKFAQHMAQVLEQQLNPKKIAAIEFTGEIIYWRGPSPYHFVAVPELESQDIKTISGFVTYGWGVIPVRVRIGSTEWTTSLFPKSGRYLVPIRDNIRKAENLELGSQVTLQIEIIRR